MKEKNKEYFWILLFITMIFLFSFYLNSPLEIFYGFFKIINEKNIAKDYFSITNTGATFFNASLITFFNIYLVYRYKLKLNGFILVGFFMGLAFGFTGKNIFIIFPFYIGVYIYSLLFKKTFKSMLPMAMLSTSLSPMVSVLGVYGFILAIFVGVLIPILSKYTVSYHGGYNLYNSGFAAGLIATLIYSILRAFNIDIDTNLNKYEQFDNSIFIFFSILFILMIIIGFLNTENFIEKLKNIYSSSGRSVTDFVLKEGFYISIFNMGTLGLFCLLISKYYNLLDGSVLCSILTVVAFGGFGKHLKNTIPLMLGIFIAKNLFFINIDNSTYLSIMFFSTCLSPISGKYGMFFGIITGIIHYALSIRISPIYGGLNLYNNGFAAGLIASIIVPILEEMKGLLNERRKEKNS